MSLSTAYVAPKPPKGGSETQSGRFPSEIALRLKKVCYTISLCEYTVSDKVVRHLLASSRAHTVGGGRPLLSEILTQN